MYPAKNFLSSILVLSLLYHKTCQEELDLSAGDTCPRKLEQIFENSAPRGNALAGKITEQTSISTLQECADLCCANPLECNVAFVYNKTCYHVKCISNEKCLPLRRNISTDLAMQLINPVTEDESWKQAMRKAELNDFLSSKSYENYQPLNYGMYRDDNDIALDRRLGELYGMAARSGPARFPSEYDEMVADESRLAAEMLRPCQIGRTDQCGENEVCISTRESKLSGICHCVEGFQWSSQYSRCIKVIQAATAERLMMKSANDEGDETAEELPNDKKKPLTVSVASKDLKLPENEVTISAFVVPDEKTSGDNYMYLWTLLSQPSKMSNGTMTDQTKDKVKLSNLSEGVYEFKVTVTGSMFYGEATTSITVSPPNRINKPPQITITPQTQTVKLPNSKAILDGSTSSDDDKIVSWHWEKISAPIGYQATLKDTSTLELDNLLLPGNYTFKLTVTDSDKATNSTMATIQVLQEIDYPPESNAGPDVIIYHPQKNVTLNGTLSTDDHEIVAWEWTKNTTVDKPVDMQNTRTPYLQLSNMEVGIYTFHLKVMDAKNQSSSSTVHVFVKPPSKEDPIISVTTNQTINLPQTWVLLNATVSASDKQRFEWVQYSGPSSTTILLANESIANATSLKVGNYSFQLTVYDVATGNNATALQNVTVVQEVNAPPKANGGGDLTVMLPLNVIMLNGSRSSDDLEIVDYTWKREGASLAMGDVIGNSSREPVLMLTNVVAGRYVFTLTVSDVQGAQDSDTVSVFVSPDPLLMNLVELTLNVEANALTHAELESLKQKLMLLLGDNVKLHIRDVRYEQKTNKIVIIFFVNRTTQDGKESVMSAVEVEQVLKEKFWRDYTILGSSVANIRTTICQNNCSGHGTCNTETRACMCETFWMPNLFYFWGVAEANCDWSILYVIIGIFLTLAILVGCTCFGVTCLCRRYVAKPQARVRPKPKNYSLLGTQDEETPSTFIRGTAALSDDSDTDSDVLFETRPSRNGILKKNGDAKHQSNGKYSMTRLGRRIKT